MATIEHLMDNKLPGEIQIRLDHWREYRWFKPYFKTLEGRWFGLDQAGASMSIEFDSPVWDPWQPEKKMIVRYLWLSLSDNRISDLLYSMAEARNLPNLKYVRLDWSATNMEE